MKYTATSLALATQVAMVFVIFSGMYYWFFFADFSSSGFEPSFEQRASAAFIAFAGDAVRAYGFKGLFWTFNEASKEHLFSAKSLTGLRRFARVEWLMVPLSLVQNAAFQTIFFPHPISENYSLSASMVVTHVVALLSAGLLLGFAETLARTNPDVRGKYSG